MHCQIEQVKQILDISTAARKTLLQEFPENKGLSGCSLKCSTLVLGLLVLNGHDAFIQKGVIHISGKELDHYWVIVYLDGEAFILDAALTQFEGRLDGEIPDVLFMPEDEAASEYGYSKGKDCDWRKEDCEENVWQAALEALKIKKPLSRVFRELEKYLDI